MFPYWTAQPWFLPLCKLCDVAYILPLTGNALFEKVHAFPCANYVKSERWEYLIGFMNLPITADPNLCKLQLQAIDA